jgi:transposase
MTKPYSMDLRERAVAAVEAGQSRRAVARLFRVGISTVIRWVQRQKSTGSCAARPMGGKRRAVLLSERDWVLARIAAAPDITIRGLRAELAARGTKVSYDTVWRLLRAERLTFKKKPARRRAGSLRRRPQARALEASSGPDRSQAPGLCR